MKVTPPVVISDIDGVLRDNKEPPSKELCEIIIRLCAPELHDIARGMLFFMITGAPVAHLPSLPALLAFAESGAVKRLGNGDYVVKGKGMNAIRTLRKLLRITREDGLDEIEEGSIIIEEPRFCSLTLLFGQPPHYPDTKTTAPPSIVEERIRRLIAHAQLPLQVIPARSRTYAWLDIVATTKAEVIKELLAQKEWMRAYYLGDGSNDLEVMRFPSIVPVGFRNSIEEIKELARMRGIYIAIPGPIGGALRFFEKLVQNELG